MKEFILGLYRHPDILWVVDFSELRSVPLTTIEAEKAKRFPTREQASEWGRKYLVGKATWQVFELGVWTE